MKVEKNKVVAMTYTLKFDDANGDIIEKVSEEFPLEVLIGNYNLFDKFEASILDLKKGDHFEFTLAPEDAYGDYEKEKLIELPKSQFETDGIFDADVVKEGAIIPMMSEEDDEHMEAIVVSVDDNNVQLDFNHPLAGEVLYFTGEIFNVREATEEELENGDVIDEDEEEE